MDSAAKAAKGALTIVVKKSILGAKIINARREDLGTIEEIVLDARNSRVAYAILSFGGFLGLGDRHFAIPWEALSFDLSEKVAVLDIDKERLRNAPGFDKDRWPDMADPSWGSQIYRHYGYEPYWESPAGRTKEPPRTNRAAAQRKRAPTSETATVAALSNAEVAEFLALQAEKARPPLNRAFRRASRRAFLWPEEASLLHERGDSLSELPGIGPYLEKLIGAWFDNTPSTTLPPSLRAGFLTFTKAQAILATRPSWIADVKGDLQMHSLRSDGTASIAHMAAAAVAMDYEYIAITDHAKSLKIAGGIDESQLQEQAAEIAAINTSLENSGRTLRVLRSIELNLNPAGEGDMEQKALAELDIVIGCFHSALRRKDDQTERYCAALRNPSIQILGHPRGRIYNYRAGLSADWPRVFALAAELDKAVEIDAYPDRQDLSPHLLAHAKKAGCRISLGTDSHGPMQLRFMVFAAASALQAGIARDRILNFMSRGELLTWVRSVRERAKN